MEQDQFTVFGRLKATGGNNAFCPFFIKYIFSRSRVVKSPSEELCGIINNGVYMYVPSQVKVTATAESQILEKLSEKVFFN